MDNYNKKLENNLLELAKQKEESDKRLLFLEIVTGTLAVVIMLALCMVASFVEMSEWLRILLIVIGLLPLIILIPFLLRIEQIAGYYECKKCKHRYIPTFKSVSMAMHMGRTRYLKCPSCSQRSWHKKVISKE